MQKTVIDHINSNPLHQWLLSQVGKPDFPIKKDDVLKIVSGKLKLYRSTMYVRAQITSGSILEIVDSKTIGKQGYNNLNQGRLENRAFFADGIRVGYQASSNGNPILNGWQYHDEEVHPALRNGEVTIRQASDQKIKIQVAETLAIGVPVTNRRDAYELGNFVAFNGTDGMEWSLKSAEGANYSDLTAPIVPWVEITVTGWALEA